MRYWIFVSNKTEDTDEVEKQSDCCSDKAPHVSSVL